MGVIVLGIDGMSPDILKKVCEYLDLPNLKKIFKNGIVTSVETVYPPSSAPAWTSIFTGTNPEIHGVFDFFDTMLLRNGIISIDKTLSSVSLWNKTIWTEVSQLKKRVLCVGIPVFYPARKLNGIYIAGELLTPRIDEKAVYPNSIYKLVKEFGYEKAFNEMHDAIARISTIKLYGTDHDVSLLINKFVNNEIIKFNIFQTLMSQDKYDLAIFVTTAYDYLAHYFLNESNIKRTINIMKPYFIALDKFAKYMLSSLDEESTLFIISDHGMHTISRVFLINNWLKMKGLLTPKGYHIKSLKITSFQKKILSMLVKISRLLNLDENLRTYIESRIKNITKAKSFVDFIDIDNSIGYCLSYSSFGIFLKQKSLKQSLIAELRSLKDTKYNTTIFSGALSYESSKKAPDIILMPNRGYTISPIILKYNKKILVDSSKVSAKIADHTIDATFVAYPKEECQSYLPRKITDIYQIILKSINR